MSKTVIDLTSNQYLGKAEVGDTGSGVDCYVTLDLIIGENQDVTTKLDLILSSKSARELGEELIRAANIVDI
jgi:hypothetical protein